MSKLVEDQYIDGLRARIFELEMLNDALMFDANIDGQVAKLKSDVALKDKQIKLLEDFISESCEYAAFLEMEVRRLDEVYLSKIHEEKEGA